MTDSEHETIEQIRAEVSAGPQDMPELRQQTAWALHLVERTISACARKHAAAMDAAVAQYVHAIQGDVKALNTCAEAAERHVGCLESKLIEADEAIQALKLASLKDAETAERRANELQSQLAAENARVQALESANLKDAEKQPPQEAALREAHEYVIEVSAHLGLYGDQGNPGVDDFRRFLIEQAPGVSGRIDAALAPIQRTLPSDAGSLGAKDVAVICAGSSSGDGTPAGSVRPDEDDGAD